MPGEVSATVSEVSAEYTERAMMRVLQGAAHAPCPRALPTRGELAVHFFSTSPAHIAPGAYVARLRKYANCSDAAFLSALALMRRLATLDRRLQPSAYNAHRLLITAVVISAKFLDHAWYTTSYYAKVGGVPSVREMNAMELAMLKLLDFRVLVPAHELFAQSPPEPAPACDRCACYGDDGVGVGVVRTKTCGSAKNAIDMQAIA